MSGDEADHRCSLKDRDSRPVTSRTNEFCFLALTGWALGNGSRLSGFTLAVGRGRRRNAWSRAPAEGFLVDPVSLPTVPVFTAFPPAPVVVLLPGAVAGAAAPPLVPPCAFTRVAGSVSSAASAMVVSFMDVPPCVYDRDNGIRAFTFLAAINSPSLVALEPERPLSE